MKTIKLSYMLCSLLSVLSIAGIAQSTETFNDNIHNVKYTVTNGCITGKYSSQYNNGNMKAEGSLINGYRQGDWKLYDSTGTLRMQRTYTSPFEYTRIFPPIAKVGPIPILSQPVYNLSRNAVGFYPYFELEQRSVIWQKRIWRSIEKTDNPALFKEDRLYLLFCKLAKEGSITLYGVNNDELTDILAYQDQFESHAAISYRIKEDSFFDADRLTMETRIIGICAVVNVNGKDTKLFWVYLPEVRPYLAKQEIKSKSLEHIKTLDDLFFFRDFASNITMEVTKEYKPISAYKQGKEIEKEAERIEMQLLNKEIDLLISFTQP
jgi:hypothetical protein